jgi:transglutaminase-like putative cysteine protease
MTTQVHPVASEGAPSAHEGAGTATESGDDTRGPAPTRSVPLGTAWLVIAMAAACMAWIRLFASPWPVAWCVVSTLLGALTAVFAHRVRRSGWIVTLAGAGVFLLLAASATVPLTGVGSPSPAALRTVVGWIPMMLAATLERGLPADPHGQPLLLAMSVSWILGITSAALRLYTRSRVAPLAAPLLLFVIALLLGSPRPTAPLLLTAPLLVCMLAYLARSAPCVDKPLSGSPVSRRWGASVRGVGLVAAFAAVVGLLVPSGDSPPSLQREPEFNPRRVISPLALVHRQITSDSPEQLATVSGAASVDRLRLAVLDEFDGTAWQSSGEFRPVGETAPIDSRPDRYLGEGSLSVLIDGLEGPWVPTVGRVSRLRLRGMQSDGPTENYVVSGGLRRGTEYTLDFTQLTAEGTEELASRERVSTDARWTQLPGSSAVPVDPSLRRPCFVSDVTSVARDLTSTEADELTADEAARTIERWLRDEFKRNESDEDYGPGHSLADLCRVLGVGPNQSQGPAPANDEQFAALMAVMVRGIGIPARVAVGYRLPAREGDGPVPVDEHDATAWTEVLLGEAGWVVFDPTPTESGPSDDSGRTQTEQGPTPIATAPLPPPDPEAAATTTTVRPPERPARPVSTQPAPIGSMIASILLLLVALAACGVVVYKRLRRARRRAAKDPGQAVIGAWEEVMDALTDLGFRPPAHLTARELALEAADFAGTGAVHRPLLRLSRLFSRSRYSTAPLTRVEAEQALALAEDARRQVHQGRSSLARSRAALSPASIRRPTRPPPATAES